MATWGSQTWGYENWGTLGDINVTLSSTNLSATLSPGTVTIDNEIQVGWGGDTWGENEWGDLSGTSPQVTGIQATFSVGSITSLANANVDVTGESLTLTNAGVVAGSSADILLSGEDLSINAGNNIVIDIGVNVTGSSINSNLGTATIDDNFLIGAGWGRDSFGSLVWGDAYSVQTGSVSATITLDSISQVTADANTLQTGEQLQTEVGTETVTGDANLTLTGIGLTSNVGQTQGLSLVGNQLNTAVALVDIQAGGNVFVNITEKQINSSLANVTLDIGVSPLVPGEQIDSAIGSVTVEANANVELTNFSGPKFSAQGNAALSTDQAKFGISSLELDGTDDSVDSTTNLDLSSTNFTIDLWIRPDNVTGYKGIWQSGTSTTEQSYLLGNQVYWTINPSTIITTSVTVNANEWTMLSYERQGNTHRIYKNGTLEDTATTANKQDSGPFSIGENGFGDFDGYIDEFRVSDIARYGGSSFTEPTQAFSFDSDTQFLLHFDGANGSTAIKSADDTLFQATFSEGQVIGGTRQDVPVTGTEATMSLGTIALEQSTNEPATGQELTTSVGDVEEIPAQIVGVSGIQLTANIGSVTVSGNALVTATGIELTSSVGSLNITSWQEIDPGVNNVWSEVDLAA